VRLNKLDKRLNIIKRLLTKNTVNSDISHTASSPQEGEIVAKLQNELKIEFKDPSLLLTALKHRSYLNVSNEDRVSSNERLEFLGDAVLDLVVTHYLYDKFPKRTEGQLSKIKSILISKPVLAEISHNLFLGKYVLINKGEEKTGGRQRQSILADCYEAIIGAIYLDQGLIIADEFIKKFLLSKFKLIMQRELYQNYKSILLEYSQSELAVLPEYRILNETGPDHDKRFKISVYLKGKKVGTGEGKSKKTAEQEAAKTAIENLKIHNS
jgi:ribonuclease-3